MALASTASPSAADEHVGPGAFRPVRARFVGSAYAGHATRFATLRSHVVQDTRLQAEFSSISGWKTQGALERLPFLPRSVSGRARATVEAAAFARWPRPDVTWSSAGELLAPFMWAQLGPLRRPLVLDLDATRTQLEEMAHHYGQRAARTGALARGSLLRERAVWRSVTVFTPWSRWAARGLLDGGVAPERIKVIPPGVDTSYWATERRVPPEGPLRLLFVGGDFERKGGRLLVNVMRSQIGQRLRLDIVTRGPAFEAPNTAFHRFEFGDPGLRDLYRSADLFVMPSLAECFGIATIEAMAAGLPTLVTDTGGASDIVVNGETGWLIPTGEGPLAEALAAIDARPVVHLREMGAAARARAETTFDGANNDREVIELMLQLAHGRDRES